MATFNRMNSKVSTTVYLDCSAGGACTRSTVPGPGIRVHCHDALSMSSGRMFLLENYQGLVLNTDRDESMPDAVSEIQSVSSVNQIR